MLSRYLWTTIYTRFSHLMKLRPALIFMTALMHVWRGAHKETVVTITQPHAHDHRLVWSEAPGQL